ncbi:TRAP transporter small permease [Paracoccus sp. S1E-3]|uniref:TRAP transporter small permease n=1 Tax=Paracoccus sp. S1E-3 TaxID=2756130 RepID=UPI0015EE9ABA|nr:TRAP transporter small permease subunit [Paracoccus sp. S1E-3]MBA4489595.1 TRAP transporter small permease subunit [Paracoccus sp. S1E-3]
MSVDATNPEKEPLAIVDRIFAWCAGALLIVIVLLTLGSVLGRFFFNRPVPDSDGLSEMASAIAVFFGLAYVQLVKGHIEVTILTDWLPLRGRQLLDLLGLVLMTFGFGLVAWGMTQGAIESYRFGDVYVGEFDLPLWPARWASALGLWLLVMRLVIDIGLAISKFGKSDTVRPISDIAGN